MHKSKKKKNLNQQSALVNNKYFKMLTYIVLGGERTDDKEGKGHLLKGSSCHDTMF